ncbi:hypothetical protein [Okeania sp. KiyG1]|uniref:hypothetical protein n=1 Tax=Okeania sp. KiyG1 TaxID=2720165 RepID=UPI0019230861|nr:hypothetical protein [Okeania sp. KiyG1]GGA05411.1 hypothetical protein CYANOKiyG1_17700 [Okeania sp. KiyG1]
MAFAPSFLDSDDLPIYGEKPNDWKPKSFRQAFLRNATQTLFMSRSETGKRTKRGLYRTGNNWCVNADCNGAANIIAKVSHKAVGANGRSPLLKPTV